ncbi:TREM1 protein, partial [Campylorhamphus procurvoides]|nr:TREM1 protein [Campylorhamphus procurvoides]
LQAQAPPAVERRREGSSLYIQCPYTAKGSNQWKSWCRLKGGECHGSFVRTSYYYPTQTVGRTTIKDDVTARIVSVTMTDLKAEDSGTYRCAYYSTDYFPLKTISLNVFKGSSQCHCACFGLSPHILAVLQGPSSTWPRSQAMSLSNLNTFVLLCVVLSILLILALITSVTLCVRLHKVLETPGDTYDNADAYENSEGTAQLGSTGRRESPKDDIKGLKYVNLDLQSRPSPEDPLYCNVEPSQAQRTPQRGDVEYAVIAFTQGPR